MWPLEPDKFLVIEESEDDAHFHPCSLAEVTGLAYIPLYKLDKGCKSIHAIQMIVSDLLLLAACSCEVTTVTAFPDVKKPSQLAQQRARSRFRSCCHNVAFPYQLKG